MGNVETTVKGWFKPKSFRVLMLGGRTRWACLCAGAELAVSSLYCLSLSPSRAYAGLDTAGKTSFLYKLKLGEEVRIIPTLGELLQCLYCVVWSPGAIAMCVDPIAPVLVVVASVFHHLLVMSSDGTRRVCSD